MGHSPPAGWWRSPIFAAMLVLLMAVPLLSPAIPPLVDLPGHLGRYHVQLNIEDSASLQRFYTIDWRLIGNLGIDLLVIPLAPLLGLEPAVKLIVILIPTLTAAGFLGIARQVHGALPPTAALALPLAYGFPFQFGFVNFALAMALGALSFWLWLWLAARDLFRARALLFPMLSCLVWLTHVFGWAVLGVLVFSDRLVVRRSTGHAWPAALLRAMLDCLPLAPPLLMMAFWRSDVPSGGTGDWFNWEAKLHYALSMLRDRWRLLDVGSVVLLATVLILAARHAAVRFAPTLLVAAGLLCAVYLLLPRILLGSAYADMRLAPFILALAVLAIGFRQPHDRRLLGAVALFATMFLLVRLGSATTSFMLYDRGYARILPAVNHIEPGSAVAALVGRPCREPWSRPRYDHLSSLALVRKDAFVNDQWSYPGAQLLEIRHAAAAPFTKDPSQFVVPSGCRSPEWMTVEDALSRLPREAFDYLWLIDPPAFDPKKITGFVEVWRSDASVLYRIRSARGD